MTFEQFQATRHAVPDIEAVLKDAQSRGPGLLYCHDCLFIEDSTYWPTDASGYGKGRWYTLIGNQEYQSDDLEGVERHLYEFALDEGYEVG